MITGENFIGSKRSANGKVVYSTINPVLNAENSWKSTEATSEEITETTALAWSAFKVYRNTTASERATFLDQIASEIEALGDVLLDMFCHESGLPKSRAVNERTRTLFQLTSLADFLRTSKWNQTSIDLADPNRQPNPKQDLRKTYIPIGPVVVFGSSNFPLAYSTAGGDTASALAVGCPVIVKSHPMHAGTGELVASAIIKAVEKSGMPNGVFSNLNSKGIEVGVQLVQDHKVKAVGFTGSIKGGRSLFDLANNRPEPIPVFAEMGSINPVIISQKSLALKGDVWASKYAESITLGTGQFCTSPGLILAIDSIELDVFAEELAKKLVNIESSCMLHPGIKQAFSSNKQVILKQDGVQQITEALNVGPNFADQTIITVDGVQFLSNPRLHQEVFGPFSMIVKCSNKGQLLQIIEGLEGQLTGTIIAEENELDEVQDILDELQHRVGRVIFNGVPTGVEVCPSMHHGGPYPATTDARFTAVGVDAIKRWLRPITFQNFPLELLPTELK